MSLISKSLFTSRRVAKAGFVNVQSSSLTFWVLRKRKEDKSSRSSSRTSSRPLEFFLSIRWDRVFCFVVAEVPPVVISLNAPVPFDEPRVVDLIFCQSFNQILDERHVSVFNRNREPALGRHIIASPVNPLVIESCVIR